MSFLLTVHSEMGICTPVRRVTAFIKQSGTKPTKPLFCCDRNSIMPIIPSDGPRTTRHIGRRILSALRGEFTGATRRAGVLSFTCRSKSGLDSGVATSISGAMRQIAVACAVTTMRAITAWETYTRRLGRKIHLAHAHYRCLVQRSASSISPSWYTPSRMVLKAA